MVIGDAKDLFLSVLGKKKVRRIREIFGGEGVPSTVMVRPKLINEKSASGFRDAVDPEHRIPDYVWDDLPQYLSDPLAITEYHDPRTGKAGIGVWIRSALRQPHRRGPQGKSGGVVFTAPIMVGISVQRSSPYGPNALVLTTAFAPEDMDKLSQLSDEGNVIYALESATKTKKRQADIWTIADVRNKTVVPVKNETPRQSNASSAEEAKGDPEAIVPSDPDQVKDQTADTLAARDDAPLPIGSARDQVFDYRTSRSIVKGLRDQARNTSDKVVATALRAYAREMTKETEEARKEYIALRGQQSAKAKAAKVGYKEGLEVGRRKLREKLAKIDARSEKEKVRNLRIKLKAEERAASGAVKELKGELREVRRAVMAAQAVLPMKLRGRFMGRALAAQTLADVSKIAHEVVAVSAQFEAAATREDIKKIRKRFNKRGMRNTARAEVKRNLDLAEGLLTGSNNRVINLDSVTETLDRLSRARDLLEIAIDVYQQDRLSWKEAVAQRRERLQADKEEEAANIRATEANWATQQSHGLQGSRTDTAATKPGIISEKFQESQDADGNGVVDIEDLLNMLGSWGACP